MKNLPRIFLVASIVCFALGASELAENWIIYLGRPVGAILFIFFMISQFLKNETALYDREQQAKLEALGRESMRSVETFQHRPAGVRHAAA